MTSKHRYNTIILTICLSVETGFLAWCLATTSPKASSGQILESKVGERVSTHSEDGYISDLADSYAAADVPTREAMLPILLTTLRQYKKDWQGSNERQLLYESSYLDLASQIRPNLPEGEDSSFTAVVIDLATLRLTYLSTPSMLKADVDAVRDMLAAGKYEECRSLCDRIISGCFSPVPGIELARGICQSVMGDYKASQNSFLTVIEMCHQNEPKKAAAAAFMSARGMLSRLDYRNAYEMFQAVQQDYPGTEFAEKAKTYAESVDFVLNPDKLRKYQTKYPIRRLNQ